MEKKLLVSDGRKQGAHVGGEREREINRRPPKRGVGWGKRVKAGTAAQKREPPSHAAREDPTEANFPSLPVSG